MTTALIVLVSAALQFQPTPNLPWTPHFGPVAPQTRINMRSPLSGSVLIAQALRAGQIRLPFTPYGQEFPFALTCSPAPCVVPNVKASFGGSPVNETPMVVDSAKPKWMLTGGNDYNCPSIQGFYASSNGGTTWNHKCMSLLAGASGDGDPAVGYDTTNASYIAGIDATGGFNSVIAFEKSTNNGTTYSAPAVAVTGIAPYTFVDKEWLQVDTAATSPRINNIYISTTEFDPNSNSIIGVANSINGGGTWTNVKVDKAVFPDVDQFSDLATAADGTVYVTWQRCSATGPTGDCGGTQAKMMISKSTDGGATWSAPVIIAKPNLAPDSCGAFYGCLPNTSERVSNIPVVDVDRSAGRFANRLYVVFYNWTGTQMRVEVSKSLDGGVTWSKPKEVDPQTNDQFFPWLNVNGKGVVGVTWLDRRLDPSNVKYDSFASISKNGGKAYAIGTRITSVSSNPFNDGFGGSFMGDYTGNSWTPTTLFASWTDTRTGVAQDEVGGYKIH